MYGIDLYMGLFQWEKIMSRQPDLFLFEGGQT